MPANFAVNPTDIARFLPEIILANHGDLSSW